MDYRDVRRAVQSATHGKGQLHSYDSALRHIGRPHQRKRFAAKNMMNDEVVEYRLLNASTQPGRGGGEDARPLLVEIAMTYFISRYIFGITVFDLRMDREPEDHDLSKLVNSPEEIAQYLDELRGLAVTPA